MLNQGRFIDLLRHGETEGGTGFRGSLDDRLSETGWKQMWSAVGGNDARWDHIISSPLLRCADFSEALAERHSISVETDERLKEMHFGEWEGRTAAQLMLTDANALSEFWQNPLRYTPPQAEPLKDFQTRVLTAWDDIVAKHNNRKMLIVSHAGVMRVILSKILDHPVQRLLEIDVGHAALKRFCIDPDDDSGDGVGCLVADVVK